MTTLDRELLELAAKAAGLTIQRSRLDDPMNCDFLMDGQSPRNVGQMSYPWNPLTDDGDALRLAVKLSLLDGLEKRASEIAAAAGFDMDPCEATRRAIVMAAAEIGRAMP